MRYLVLIVLMFWFAGASFADRCRAQDIYGNEVYVECERRGLSSMGTVNSALQNLQGTAMYAPMPLDSINQRRMQSQQHNLQMQILQLQAERQRLEVERQRLELERLRKQSLGPQGNKSSYQYGRITEIPRNTNVDASWSNGSQLPDLQPDPDWLITPDAQGLH